MQNLTKKIDVSTSNNIIDKNSTTDLEPNKVKGLLSFILGIISLLLYFVEDSFCALIIFIPVIGSTIVFIIKTCPFFIKLTISIIAIVFGIKSENTISRKLGNLGRIFGIITTVLVPTSLIINIIFTFIYIIIGITSISFIYHFTDIYYIFTHINLLELDIFKDLINIFNDSIIPFIRHIIYSVITFFKDILSFLGFN